MAPKKKSPKLPKSKKPKPFRFFAEALEQEFEEAADSSLHSRLMFGCQAYYVGPKIVVILREGDTHLDDNGIWVVSDFEHHASLKKDFPTLRRVALLSEKGTETRWQNLPSSTLSFEEDALRLVTRIASGDQRIGRIPTPKRKKS